MTDQPDYGCTSGGQPAMPTLVAEYNQLVTELAALQAVARGYCPDCGRGDAAPTADDWERERQRANRAEAALAVVTAKATEWTALAPADDWGNTPQDTALADAGRYLLKLMADATKETP